MIARKVGRPNLGAERDGTGRNQILIVLYGLYGEHHEMAGMETSR